MDTPTLTLFYDGLCPLCSREMDYYRKKVAGDPTVVFVDIMAPEFDAAAHGLDPVRVHKVMHVKVGETVHLGLDAFIAVWRRMPGQRWMAGVASVPVIHQLLWLAYYAFAFVRPWLPRRKADCATGACERPAATTQR